jgi:hypothetical protein
MANIREVEISYRLATGGRCQQIVCCHRNIKHTVYEFVQVKDIFQTKNVF